MQNKPSIKTAVEENVTNVAVPKVVGEWTTSKYTTVKDNWPKTNETAEQDTWGKELRYPALFPLRSVTKPFRDPGIIYSTNYDSYSASYSNADTNFGVNRVTTYRWGIGDPVRNDNRLYPRTYIADRDNKFAYWISSARTLAKADAYKARGEFSCTLKDGSRALQLDIEYDAAVTTNKITVKFNTHIGNPQGVFFSIKKGGVWTQVASGLNVPNNGVLEVYRPYIPGDQTTPGSWTTTQSLYTDATKNSIDVDGIRVGITSMQRTTPVSAATEAAANASVEIVEFNPKLVIDLTERTDSYEVSNDLATNEFSDKLMGNISTNTGSISFINDDGFFDTTTTTGPLTGKLDENVEFTVDLIYDASIGGTLADRTVRQLTMLSDTWTSNGEDQITVSLVDYSKVLQEAKAQEIVAANIPAFAAIWLLCDGIGFNRVSVDRSDDRDGEEDLMMEYFWASGDQPVWEIIQEIASSYQLAVFFNEFGTLKVMTRKYLWDRDSATTSATPSDLTLYGTPNGAKLASINTMDRSETHVLNKATVRYQAVNKYSISGRKNERKSRNSILWQAEDPTVVGAAEIVQSFDAGATQIKIDPRYEDSLFKYHGRFQIEETGYIVEYTAKKYHLTATGVAPADEYLWIKNESDMQAAYEINNGYRPEFTGWLKLANPAKKRIDSVVYDIRENWQCVKFIDGGVGGTNDFNPMRFRKIGDGKNSGGALEITTSFTAGARYKVWKKDQTYNEYDRVGIKFKMVKGSSPEAGVVIFPQGSNMAAGYHISVTPNDHPSGPKINVKRVNTNGGEQVMDFNPVNDYEGPKVDKGRWYYLEAVIWGNDKDWRVSVYINGNFCGTWDDTSANALSRTQKAQFFVRGDGKVLFDKFYVVNTRGKKGDRKNKHHNTTRKDLLYNSKACPGDGAFKEYLEDAIRGKYKAKIWTYGFNGAGWATARELQHFKVKFELPAIRQNLYVSNKNVHPIMYKRGPMSATFTLKNMSERNQLIQGEHSTRVSGSNHTEATLITAISFRLQEEQKVVYRDRDIIHSSGEAAFDIDATWIQTRSAAESLGQFVRDRFGLPSRNYSLEIYGNPLIQLGDIVTVYWPGKSISSYTYLVNSVSHNWEPGLSTTVGLTMRQDIPTRKVQQVDETVDENEMIPPNMSQISAYNYQGP
jgi:hypothetical protein